MVCFINSMDNRVQNEFIRQAVADKTHVNLYLNSGIRLQGRIADADDNSILFTVIDETAKQLIYKTAIAVILPKSKTAT